MCHWLEYDELEDMTSYEIPTIDQSNKAYRVNITRLASSMDNAVLPTAVGPDKIISGCFVIK